MRIAMPLRQDAGQVFGGDSRAMLQLSEGLRALGVDSVVAPFSSLPEAREFDLVHLFNYAPLEYALTVHRWASASSVPIVFSPLFHATYRHWFETAIRDTTRWRMIYRLLGRRSAWLLYQRFQDGKMPAMKGWRQGRRLLTDVACVAGSTSWENRYLAQHFRLGSEVVTRMGISPLGIDAGLFGRSFTEAESDAFRARHHLPAGYLLEVARIEPKKQQAELIEALFNEPLPLVFAGRPLPYEPEYAARAHALGTARGNVTFLDWLPDEDLPLLYAGAAAHILPSWIELPGLSSLEAGACGTRVIVSRDSSAVAILGSDAWYCDPFDSASLRSTVRAALLAPVPVGLRSRLLADHSWPRSAEINLALYDEVLRRFRDQKVFYAKQ